MRGFMHEHGPKISGNKLTRSEYICMALALVGIVAIPVLMVIIIKST